jgi:hypothetical protein
MPITLNMSTVSSSADTSADAHAQPSVKMPESNSVYGALAYYPKLELVPYLERVFDARSITSEEDGFQHHTGNARTMLHKAKNATTHSTSDHLACRIAAVCAEENNGQAFLDEHNRVCNSIGDIIGVYVKGLEGLEQALKAIAGMFGHKQFRKLVDPTSERLQSKGRSRFVAEETHPSIYRTNLTSRTVCGFVVSRSDLVVAQTVLHSLLDRWSSIEHNVAEYIISFAQACRREEDAAEFDDKDRIRSARADIKGLGKGLEKTFSVLLSK